MRLLRQILAVAVLTLIIAISTSAGQMDTGYTAQPTESADGQMDTGYAGQMDTGATAKDSSSSLIRVALLTLQSVLPRL